MFKLKSLVVIGLLLPLFSGCTKKGDKGDNGINGTANIQVLSGLVSSNDFTVTDTDIGKAKQISVYATVGGALIQMPIYNVSGGFNVFYVKSGSSIEIINAQAGSATSYTIVLIIP